MWQFPLKTLSFFGRELLGQYRLIIKLMMRNKTRSALEMNELFIAGVWQTDVIQLFN